MSEQPSSKDQSLAESLRAWADSNLRSAKYGPGLLRIAADEIERLQRELAESQYLLNAYRGEMSAEVTASEPGTDQAAAYIVVVRGHGLRHEFAALPLTQPLVDGTVGGPDVALEPGQELVSAVPLYRHAPPPELCQRFRVLAITTAYESGFGHGKELDELPNPYSEGGDEHEAYSIGYEQGEIRRRRNGSSGYCNQGAHDICTNKECMCKCHTPAKCGDAP